MVVGAQVALEMLDHRSGLSRSFAMSGSVFVNAEEEEEEEEEKEEGNLGVDKQHSRECGRREDSAWQDGGVE